MLKNLVMIRLRAMFAATMAQGKKRNSKGKVILLTLLLLYAVAAFGFLFANLFGALYDAFMAAKMEWLYFGFMGLMIFALCFIGSVFVTQQQLFEAKDNDLLLSMPVPVRNILISRLMSILILNYIFEALVALPGTCVCLYKGQAEALGLVFLAVILLILPLLVMTLSALFGWLIALADSKVGKKNLVMTVLALILLLAYLYVCFSMQNYMMMLVENGEVIASAIRKVLPPFYYMGTAAAEGSVSSFLLFIACCIVPFAVIYRILSKSFIRLATTSKGHKKIAYKEKEIKPAGVKAALRRKEMSRFISSPMYMFNAGIGLVFLVIGAGYLFIKRDSMELYDSVITQITGDEGILTAAVCALFGLILSMNIISAPTVSLEAKTFWIPRSLPVSAKDVLKAKASVHILVSLPCVAAAIILVEVSLPLSITGRILTAVFPVIMTVFSAYLGLVLNLIYPKLDWINEIDAVKQGAAPILTMFIAAAAVMVPAVIYAVLLFGKISAELYTAIVTALFAAGTAALYSYTLGKGVKKFEEL